ncbi:LemA family protein [Pontibacter diazotrophicus]|uniref:LemA family protein n=1 Tax=Pontibacter diazotrophicus TaxID=1400979 RepID=A0A3D8L5J3_9BACT|nr:LemA family protein [Pontibacter diazotrophicus]RDV12553.1 LemA family protein [Pontibacter diazotrophicus]
MRKLFFYLIGFVILASQSSCGYNTLVQKDETVEAQWANVQNAYQRRADLVPNLVNTVKGAADFERGTLTDVIEARAKATSVNISPDNLTPENIERFQQAQGELSGALSRLLVSVERYPELRANQNFLELQAQLEGTENRIAVERRKFNETVQDYNTTVRSFPTNLMAGMFGFERKGHFQADPGAQQAPTVQF